MSGGVDSSVAALLLQKQGFHVTGAFLKTYSDTKDLRTGECTWREDYRMAQRVADLLGIELIFIDAEKEYQEKVLALLFRDYARGLTPNPDLLCNSVVKFPFLLRAAKEHRCDFIATGHYARIKKNKDTFSLARAIDSEKDQSYFLATLTQKDLANTLFPIGLLKKGTVRALAHAQKFPNWDRPGTRGICFVGKQDMKRFLKRKISEKPGSLVDAQGTVIGTHPGSMYFTIGERIREKNGISLFPEARRRLSGKLYVGAKLKKNILVAVSEGDPLLEKREVFLTNIHFIEPEKKNLSLGLRARVRHLGELYPGKLVRRGTRWLFIFQKPVSSLADGQYLVLYEGIRVVGCAEMRFA